MKRITLLLLSVLILSCSEDDDTKETSCIEYDVFIQFDNCEVDEGFDESFVVSQSIFNQANQLLENNPDNKCERFISFTAQNGQEVEGFVHNAVEIDLCD